METLILKSRSISQDRFFDKRSEDNYKKHANTINNIAKNKPIPILANFQFRKSLSKFKSSSKKFNTEQNFSERKKKDIIMVNRLKNPISTIDNFNPQHNRFPVVKGSHAYLNKNKIKTIKEENIKLCTTIVALKDQLVQNKKKIKQQIDQYLKIREKIRKCRFFTEEKDKFIKKKQKPQFSTRQFQKLYQINAKKSQSKKQKKKL